MHFANLNQPKNRLITFYASKQYAFFFKQVLPDSISNEKFVLQINML